MKKGTGLLLIVAFLLLAIIVVVVKSYSKLTTVNTEVINKESDINVQLSRKKVQIATLNDINNKYLIDQGDLLLNIVTESNFFLTSDDIDEKCEKNNKVSEYINSYFDKIPQELLANEDIKTFIKDILLTEKRIETAKNNYNKAVEDYNSQIKKFPSSLIANIRGFKEKKEFEITVEIKQLIEE